MIRSRIDVAIIGAGPYGLSIASFLRERGIEHRIFGPPMHAWRTMPAGMNLKSLGFATTIPTAQPHESLPDYCLTRGLEDYEPITIATFARYGMSVQQHVVPYVEDVLVQDLRKVDDTFVLTLGTGEVVHARHAVVATGLSNFERMPSEFDGLPADLASHTAQHDDFSGFAGTSVAVVGAGQSALQAAALLHENGARTQVLARGDVLWVLRGAREFPGGLLRRMRYPNSVLGRGRGNWVLQHIPMLLHHFSDERRMQFNRTHLGPAGAWWLRDRVDGKFPVRTRTRVVAAAVKNGKVSLQVQAENGGQSEVLVDHVVAGTGYEANIARLPYLAPQLAQQVQRLEGAPRLSGWFESSVPGLYFVGPSAANSFGPLFRFVCGAAYASPLVAGHLAWRSAGTRALGRRPASLAARDGISSTLGEPTTAS